MGGEPTIDGAEAVRLLGPARMVLDRCAEGVADPAEAAVMAQRIVDVIGHRVTDEPPHAIVLISEMADALSEALEFFVARDEMNAKVHLASPRWSPITEQCRRALEAWRIWRYPAPAVDESPTD
jgi:hypothetical protein